MKRVVEKTLNLNYSDVEHNLALKPYSLLNFLQDMAGASAEELDFGYSRITPLNYAWFLIKYRMEFTKYPSKVRSIQIKTQPRGYNRLFAYREYEITSKDEVIGKIFSSWSVFDMTNNKTVPIAQVFPNNQYMQPYEKKDTDLAFSKIKPINKIDIQKEFEVRYSDLDVNQHANNGNFIIWAFEPLSFEFKTNHQIRTLDIVFKRQAKFGEKIISQVEFLGELKTIHCLKNENNEDLCLVECTWQ